MNKIKTKIFKTWVETTAVTYEGEIGEDRLSQSKLPKNKTKAAKPSITGQGRHIRIQG